MLIVNNYISYEVKERSLLYKKYNLLVDSIQDNNLITNENGICR